ncbi:MAG: sulfite exporter TauE/SafE family protein [Planctomycetota bacterium]|jgi:uncharacterized membrane protein YfcA
MTGHIVLVVAAFVTAAISAVIGMGGGILLLATLFCFLPHPEAIPTHATVQLVSNSTRMVAFLRDVHWPTIGRFLLGVIPGGTIGVLLLALAWRSARADAAEPYLKMLVGVYILVTAHLPRSRKGLVAGRWWDFPLLGLVAGAAALTVGAVGPLIAPLFARRDFVKESLRCSPAATSSRSGWWPPRRPARSCCTSSRFRPSSGCDPSITPGWERSHWLWSSR